MFVLELSRGPETRTFAVRSAGLRGWELNEQTNRRQVRTVRYTDWHRVERAIALIRFEAAALERDGWKTIDPFGPGASHALSSEFGD